MQTFPHGLASVPLKVLRLDPPDGRAIRVMIDLAVAASHKDGRFFDQLSTQSVTSFRDSFELLLCHFDHFGGNSLGGHHVGMEASSKLTVVRLHLFPSRTWMKL